VLRWGGALFGRQLLELMPLAEVGVLADLRASRSPARASAWHRRDVPCAVSGLL
jgi:hypothetical protein